MKLENIRELLGIPNHIRIGQHIYNSFRHTEVISKNERGERNGQGIDCFSIEDEDFIKRLKEK